MHTCNPGKQGRWQQPTKGAKKGTGKGEDSKGKGKGPTWIQDAFQAPAAPPPQAQQQKKQPKQQQQTAIRENGQQATMLDNKGNTVPIVWICYKKSCCYPHHANRPTCVNCKAKWVKEQEPTNFVRSKVKVIGAKPQQETVQAQPSSTAATQQAATQAGQANQQAEGPAQQQADATQQPETEGADAGHEDANMEPEASPSFVPTCLSAGTVKFLIANDIDVATSYEAHFDVEVQGLSELQPKLDLANRRFAVLETADADCFGDDLVDTKAKIK